MHDIRWIVIIILFVSMGLPAQKAVLDGYVFEDENRGFLGQVEIKAYPNSYSTTPIAETYSDAEGHFVLEVPPLQPVFITAGKQLFHTLKMDTTAPAAGQKLFLKLRMIREPGYIFEMLIAKATDDPNAPMESIKNTRIEIFNNTTDKEELVLENYPKSEFNFTFKKGNHYTIMIRKKGFLTRRMEAYVNVRGCILCFDGIGSIEPNVTDNINSDQQHGTLLSTVLLRPAVIGSSFKIRNIHYDYNKYFIRPDAAVELDKVVKMLKDNPALEVELGSHTDARGKDSYNMRLSQKRAEAAVQYIVKKGIDAKRISAKGYGETHILNRCKNGVNCSDKEHEVNRRTEIKITGINEEKSNSFKSLQQIIHEENFMRKVMEGEPEVVEYKEGEDMPEDLKKFLKQKEQKQADKPSTPIVKPDTMPTGTNGPKMLATIPSSARIPSDFTGYLLFLESRDDIISQDDKHFNGLKSIFIEDEAGSGNTYRYYTGPFTIYSEAVSYLKKMKKSSTFKSLRLVLFKNGKPKQ